MKDFYEQYWLTRGKSGPRPRYIIFSNWIEPNSKVLELGCGDGFFGQFLKERKKVDYLGIDISKAAVEIASQRGLNVLVGNAEEDISSYPENSYDYVIISEVIEHVVNSEEVLLNAKKIARRGVLVSIPNIAYWKFRLQLLLGSFPKQWAVDPKEHLRFWSVTDFTKSMNSLGFKIERIKASNGKKILRDLYPNLFGFQVCFFLKRVSKS